MGFKSSNWSKLNLDESGNNIHCIQTVKLYNYIPIYFQTQRNNEKQKITSSLHVNIYLQIHITIYHLFIKRNNSNKNTHLNTSWI